MAEREREAPPEARIEATPDGLEAAGEGWYVLNAAEAAWRSVPGAGSFCAFEPADAEFPDFGINVHVLTPGEPNAMYHAENVQEDFLVLSGECLLIVEGQERRLRAWDFVHCPAWTRHVFVGAGDGPCAVLMVGTRRPDIELEYPADPVAQRHGAGVARATSDPEEAYRGEPPPVRTAAPPLLR